MSNTFSNERSRMVKCDLCGRIYNQSYLASHKRLSHKGQSAPASVEDAKAVDMILALFMQVPAKTRRDVLDRLAALLELC